MVARHKTWLGQHDRKRRRRCRRRSKVKNSGGKRGNRGKGSGESAEEETVLLKGMEKTGLHKRQFPDNV